MNFRTPATHKMAPWVKKAFIDFLPKYLFIERPPSAPPTDDQPSAEVNAGFNIVFPETLEERNSVSRLLNHAQYDGGGFRYTALEVSNIATYTGNNTVEKDANPKLT